jgi:hypothetical protein
MVLNPTDSNRIWLGDGDILDRVPGDIIRAAEKARTYLIESDSLAFIWVKGRCVVSIARKNESIEGFRGWLDIIFAVISAVAGEVTDCRSRAVKAECERHTASAQARTTSEALARAINLIRRMAAGEEVNVEEEIKILGKHRDVGRSASTRDRGNRS